MMSSRLSTRVLNRLTGEDENGSRQTASHTRLLVSPSLSAQVATRGSRGT